MENWDLCVYWIRIESRVLSGLRGFAEAYAITGPPNCGKSKLLLRTMHCLGDGPHNLCRLLPNNYLVNVAERDSEASRPVTNRLRGCRGVTIKESDAKKIQPSALKGILDMTDVNVDARANNSKELDQTSFPVTWSIVFASNAPVEINTVGDTTGLGDD